MTVILFYGLSVISFTYLASFLFKSHSSAQNAMLMVYIMTGAILLIVSVILDIIESTRDANRVLKYFYRLIPSYCFGEALVNEIVRDAASVFGEVKGVWDMEIVGWPLVFMALESVIYFALVLLVEKILATPEWYSVVRRTLFPKTVEAEEKQTKEAEVAADKLDEDIAAEAERVRRGDADNDMIRLVDMKKVYEGRYGAPPKVAVRGLNFGIPEGECFGFLGINGAGKTTTLRMLTGDEVPTSGTAYMNQKNILTQMTEIRHLLGYCPQFDALLPTLTGRETLTLYSRIKGVREDKISGYVDRMINQLGLTAYADEPCGGYSGGNKRKLSVGVSLVGNPSIVILDEPSTGMDPGARRWLWQLIASTMVGRSVILTTHSLDEAVALCSRIGIMVGGQLRCLGSAQHLKQRYGSGFQIDINTGTNTTKAARHWVRDTFPGAELIERHASNLKYRVPRGDAEADGSSALPSIFEAIEANRKQVGISEYSVSETTLEQIFIHFAAQQEEERGHVAGLSNLNEDEMDAEEDAAEAANDDFAVQVDAGVEEEKEQ
eukprot:TRINITY_DN67703_c4_g1_i7.p1 TRINITY_DN67703_c4_g1~~TRINITY_DN67703_c4_g1_i7.p1  ORF type:complete len:613 (-),score=314.03 TRINITY_DN67703_c4_g1_i7:62-1711(-)